MSGTIEPPNPPLTDGVVRLRPFRAGDVAAITTTCQDPAIGRWIPMIPVPYAESDAREFILSALAAWKDGSGYQFAIVDPETNRYVGSIGLHIGPLPGRLSIGYLVAPEARGRGIATRALRLATRWAFETLMPERLALWTLPGNVASQAVAERAGFRYEGLLRNWAVGRDGGPVDVVMFGLTPEDLEEAAAAREPAEPAAPESGSPTAARSPVAADGPAEGASSAVARVARYPRELAAPGTRAAPFFEILDLSSLAPGSLVRATLAGLDLLVAWTPAGIIVTDDRCPHMAAPLSLGDLEGCVVACPLHEGKFDLSSGETVQMPTTGGLDADGNYHSPRTPEGTQPRPEPPTRKQEARRLTRVNRLRYYPARIREGRLEAHLPILPQ